jgi:hypothetical protein
LRQGCSDLHEELGVQIVLVPAHVKRVLRKREYDAPQIWIQFIAVQSEELNA